MLPQFNVTIPALPNTFVTEFISIANFDVIEMDVVTEFIGLDQPEVPPFNDRLDTVGFGDTYFIHNCGALFLIILLLFLLWLFVLLCSKKNLCGFKAKRNRIQKWLNLRAVTNLLQGPVGSAFSLVIERNGAAVCVEGQRVKA